MPTNDERREVAARLQRIIGKCKYYYPLCLLYNEIIGGNCEAVGRNVEECDNECFDSLLSRLADLIEPEERTCRMHDANWDDGQCTWGCICSKCGAKHEHKRSGWMNFCPNCGARVVHQ